MKNREKNIKVIENNKKILGRYIQYCKNKGLTTESIKAMCFVDIPLFLKFISDKKIEDVTHNDISDFLTYCSDTRKNLPQTICRKYTSLCSFYKAIIKQEFADIARNPLDKIDKPKKREKVREYLTKEEFDKLLEYTDQQQDLRGSALLSFLYSSACRLTEVWQQNHSNLDYQKRQFKVLGKGAKERTCVLSTDCKDRIMAYLESRTDDNNALFVSKSGTIWGRRSIQRYVKKIGKDAGISKNIHPHIFRHTRAMFLIKNGVPLEKIQKLLGHSNISTTQIYAHIDIEDVQSIIDNLDKN